MNEMIYCFNCGKPIHLGYIFTERITCPECGCDIGANEPERVLRKDGKPLFQ